MKGLILAGGAGSRLYPASLPISKILLPVYDKPMIYYPITTLMLAGIRDILIISNPNDLTNFQKVLKDGSELGIKFSYAVQKEARGIADSFLIAEDFIQNSPVALILGDNIFHGFGFSSMLKMVGKKTKGATVFGYQVNDPQRFGVVEFDKNLKAISIEEKPAQPKSNYAVVGLYFYQADVVEKAKNLKPSKRGELEITDINTAYLREGRLNVVPMRRGNAWLDAGTPQSLLDASNFIGIIEKRQDLKIACIEEIAWRRGFIDSEQLYRLGQEARSTDYGKYILSLVGG